MAAIFEYDVFLSFASSDEEIVKPVWQELCLSGLRVFWSDAALKKELGNSWFEIIESSLDRSRHMLLVCSPASMNSVWVKREYRAFLEHCYNPGVRRLIPILVQGYKASDLPLFLREIEAAQLGAFNSLKEIISMLGGVNIEELRGENLSLKQNIEFLRRDKLSLEQEVKELKEQLLKNEGNNEATIQQDTHGTKLEGEHKTDEPPIETKNSQSEKLGAFEFLGLASDASSQEILRKYESIKNEYEALINNCPKGLREVCELRLQELEHAFKLVFSERKREEDQKIESAYELLQLPVGTVHRATITKRYRELKTACLKAKQCFDAFIKEAATKELEKLEEAFLILIPKETSTADNARQERFIIDVIMPQMGESIAEGTITKWMKKEGEQVERDEPLFEISTDKVDAEIPSPAAGILKEIIVVEGETVAVNTTVAQIEETKSKIFAAAIEAGKQAYLEEKRKTEAIQLHNSKKP